MSYLLLAVAIVAEVFATMNLRASEGLSRLLPSLGALAGYSTAIWLLAMALARGMPVGVAYAIWSAVGLASVAALSWWLFSERLTAVQGGGLVLIVAGVVALELGAAR